MARIDVPSETLLVEMGENGLNILETTMQMSSKDESTQVQCDICSKLLGKMEDVKHIESPESITIAVRNGFKPEQMMKATEDMLKEEGEENPDEIMKIVFNSWKSSSIRAKPHGRYVRTAIKAFKYISKRVEVEGREVQGMSLYRLVARPTGKVIPPTLPIHLRVFLHNSCKTSPLCSLCRIEDRADHLYYLPLCPVPDG